MLGSVRDDGGVMTKTGVASGSVYLASGNVRELRRVRSPPVPPEVMGLTEQDYGRSTSPSKTPRACCGRSGATAGRTGRLSRPRGFQLPQRAAD